MRRFRLTPRSAVEAIALSPDGRTFAVAQVHCGVTVRDIADGRELGRCPVQSRGCGTRLEYAPDGRHLAAGHGRGLDVIEVPGGRLVGRVGPAGASDFRFLTGRPELMAACEGGYELIRYAPRTAFARDFEPVVTRLTPLGSRHVLAICPDTNWVLATDLAYPWELAVYAFGPPRRIATYRAAEPIPPKHDTFRVASTPSRFVIADRSAVRVFEWPAGDPGPEVSLALVSKFAPTKPQPDPLIPPFALTPCGNYILIRGEKSRVELRAAATGDVLTVWKWGLPRTLAVAVSSDGLLAAAAGTQGRVVVWDLG